ncbi:aldo/keto reductase [Actinomadura violacea]|uniref:Aldo/keto reductase n=1 Tax=Actinomadura violacea TaxID=2819934 RepID=A0ABS3SBP6_9ACTN|nr:aldo/keto reductase [Actinomadura violacea]MBO2465998.1 aldo/keto reductase [Actinomadura violacea]
MMAELGLGTYRCRDVTTAARAAIAAGVTVIDTAPVYAHGNAHDQLADLLLKHPGVRISTKAGHMTRRQARAAQQAGLITPKEAARCHCIAPAYLRHRITTNIAEIGRDRLDLLYLHNPEHDAHGDRDRLLKQITQAFTTFEEAAHQDDITGYGIATWSGFTSGAFTTQDIITAAQRAAGSTRTHLQAIQLPVSLIELTSVAKALHGVGPIAEAAEAGLEVWASAPLNGGELANLLTPDLAEFINAGFSHVAAALAVVASTPGITGALLSASTTAHWHEALRAFQGPAIPPTHLQEICRVLRT